jgi:uncharacterized membrane protein
VIPKARLQFMLARAYRSRQTVRTQDGPVLALTLYTFLKFLHVLLAIVAIGFNASYGIWLARAARQPQYLAFTLRGVKVLDDRVSNPAYGLLLITGLSMVWVGDLSLTTLWLGLALGLYVVLVLVGALGYTPTLRQQIRTLDEQGADSDEFRRLSNRGRTLGIALAIIVLAIVFLMVTKPT